MLRGRKKKRVVLDDWVTSTEVNIIYRACTFIFCSFHIWIIFQCFIFFPEYLIFVQLFKATALLRYLLNACSFSFGPKRMGLHIQYSLGKLV